MILILGTSNCGRTNGGCEQLCFHKVPNGTVCKCQTGMTLASDGKSCENALKHGKGVTSCINKRFWNTSRLV